MRSDLPNQQVPPFTHFAKIDAFLRPADSQSAEVARNRESAMSRRSSTNGPPDACGLTPAQLYNRPVGTAATLDLRERADARVVAATRAASIPWYVWCLAAATAADFFGGY